MRFDTRGGPTLAALAVILIAALMLTAGPVEAKKPPKGPTAVGSVVPSTVNVDLGDAATWIGSESVDAVAWTWELIGRPAGSSAVLPASQGANCGPFYADVVGTYTARLTVTDAQDQTDSCTVTLTAIDNTPQPSPGGIYYTEDVPPDGGLWRMDADGSDRTQLPVTRVAGDYEYGGLSSGTHNGVYWLVRAHEIPDEFFPDGTPRRELFAVRETGGPEVQLTEDSDLALPAESRPVWVPGDLYVSYVGVAWSGTSVVEAGIYRLPVTFDGDGNVSGAGGPPALVLASTTFERADGRIRTNFAGIHDWSPDGARIVYNSLQYDVYRYDLATSITTFLSPGRNPQWSPDGAKIAMQSGGVTIMNPDGTGKTTIVPDVVKRKATYYAWTPRWSPDSTQLAYGWSQDFMIYRVDADGSDKTGLATGHAPLGWR